MILLNNSPYKDGDLVETVCDVLPGKKLDTIPFNAKGRVTRVVFNQQHQSTETFVKFDSCPVEVSFLGQACAIRKQRKGSNGNSQSGFTVVSF